MSIFCLCSSQTLVNVTMRREQWLSVAVLMNSSKTGIWVLASKGYWACESLINGVLASLTKGSHVPKKNSFCSI